MNDKMIFSDECYLRETCWKYNNRDTAECKTQNIYCPRLFRMDYLFESSLMSLKQRQHQYLRLDADGTDRDAFNTLKEIETDIEKFVSKGKNLYIFTFTAEFQARHRQHLRPFPRRFSRFLHGKHEEMEQGGKNRSWFFR